MAPRSSLDEGLAWKARMRTALSQAPKSLRAPLIAQICQFVHQAEFLRKSLHVQLEITKKNCVEVLPQVEHEALQHTAHPAAISPEAEAQLCQVFSMVHCVSPDLAHELSAVLQVGPEPISEWFSEKSAAMNAACRQLAKKSRLEQVGKGAKTKRTARGPAPRNVLPGTTTAGMMLRKFSVA